MKGGGHHQGTLFDVDRNEWARASGGHRWSCSRLRAGTSTVCCRLERPEPHERKALLLGRYVGNKSQIGLALYGEYSVVTVAGMGIQRNK